MLVNVEDYFDLTDFAHRELFDQFGQVWQVVGGIGDYLASIDLGKIEGEVSPDAHLVNPELISIGAGSVVEPGAYIKGPFVMGKNGTVRHGAYVRRDVVAGDNVVIGHATETKNAVFLNNAAAGHFNYIGDSIVGAHVNVGAGARLANYRLDGRDIIINKTIKTGQRKFGAILGDGVSIGCNAVLNPGTLVAKGVQIYPCTHLGGYVV